MGTRQPQKTVVPISAARAARYLFPVCSRSRFALEGTRRDLLKLIMVEAALGAKTLGG
jgi:hypothetical protein